MFILAYRFLYSYTLISIPNSYNWGYTWEGGNKYFFPVCIINPLKKSELVHKIISSDLFKKKLEDGNINIGNELLKIKSFRKDDDQYFLVISYSKKAHESFLVKLKVEDLSVIEILTGG